MIMKNGYSFKVVYDDFHINQKLLNPELSSISFVGHKEKCAYPDLTEILSSCCLLLLPLFNHLFMANPKLALYFYTAFIRNEPLNRIGRYKKLWKSDFIPATLTKDKECILGPELELCDGSYAFGYAGLVKIPITKISEVLEIARMNNHCAVLISDEEYFFSEENVKKIYYHNEPTLKHILPRPYIDWIKLTTKCCNDHTVAIRAAGQFDDPEAGVDIIGIQSSEIYKKILGLTESYPTQSSLT